jgi:hypothetical protein
MRRAIWLTMGMVAGLAAAWLNVGEAVGAAAPGRATVAQEQQKDVAITIYNGNLGLVKDIRTR